MIKQTFHGCTLKEEHILQLNFDIPREGDSWSRLFEKLETVSTSLNWDDYSLSQTTLEQVFIEFSRDAGQGGPYDDIPSLTGSADSRTKQNGYANRAMTVDSDSESAMYF